MYWIYIFREDACVFWNVFVYMCIVCCVVFFPKLKKDIGFKLLFWCGWFIITWNCCWLNGIVSLALYCNEVWGEFLEIYTIQQWHWIKIEIVLIFFFFFRCLILFIDGLVGWDLCTGCAIGTIRNSTCFFYECGNLYIFFIHIL